ncbi:MAG: hypothetical protein ACRDI2_25470, partial [Chloroflexota bacterium]
MSAPAEVAPLTPFSSPAAGPNRGTRPVGADGERHHLLLYGVLAALAVTLGLARLATGPWYHVYTPPGVVLLDGWPAEWEAVYFLEHFPAFIGDGVPRFGIAPVQYRTLLTLYLASLLYAWTGNAFWSLAVVDLLFWCLAGVAGYHLAQRLGAGRRAAALSAVLLVGSPLLVSNMWAHVLHVAEFASLPLGLWAALVLVDEHRRPWHLAIGWGALLLWLSVSYHYQWIVAPMLLVLAITHPRLRGLQVLAVLAGAALLYLAGTVAAKAVVAAAAQG